MEFGRTLREARERKNYTVSQIADITHMLPQIISGLEEETFKHIAAPIYGRGFVKMYCEVVELDVKTMQDAFMKAFNGEEPSSAVAAPPPSNEPTAPEPPPSAPLFAEKSVSPEARYATPAGAWKTTRFAMPRIPWRLVVSALVALVALWLVITGARALWRALAADPESTDSLPAAVETAKPAATERVETATNPAAASEKRKPAPVKSLYID